MRKEGTLKNKVLYSRRKARALFKKTYMPNLPSHIVVHHKDHNPLNNDINNLTPMESDSHMSHHLKGKIRRVNLKLRELESLLVIFNDR